MKSLILHRHLFWALAGVFFSHSIKAQSNTPVAVNYNVTGFSVVVPAANVSANEGVEAFRNLPQFPEALVPTSTPSDSDNAVLANAVNAFLSRGTPDDYSALQDFLIANPVSPWRVAVLVNLGILQEKGGYFTKALGNLTTAWSEGQGLSSNEGIMLADRAYADLLELQSHLGHVVETMNLIGQSSGRVWTSKTPRVIEIARKVVADMKNAPQSPSFQCGPTSLGQVAAALHTSNAMDVILAGHHAVSDTNGYSLAQLGSMSQQYGLPLQMAYRSQGAAILTPAVIHLGVGHYSALTQHDEKNGYLLQDTSFNQQIWMSSAAVDAESSGYFLVPVGPLPSGWRSVGGDEAMTVWGSGNTPSKNPSAPSPITPYSCGRSSGMPVATINLQEASALIRDTPVGYQPPVGPRIDFTFTIDEGNTSQPSMMNFCNMGSLASFNWLGYIEFNPSTPTASVTLYARGGGVEIYQGYNTNTMSYLIGQNTGVGLKHLSSTTFARIFPDGSQEIYAQDDGVVVGSGTTLKRAFLSQLIDPHGNTITLSYDSLRRIVGITDPIGQVTTLSYGSSGDPYKITQVTDPFGRSATFSYTSSGLLTSSTDALGLTTTFACNGSILMSMTTPYGTTSFSVGNNGGDNTWVQITDPLGGTERAESWPTGAPKATNSDPLGTPSGMNTINNYLQYRTTYYWGKHAWMMSPGN